MASIINRCCLKTIQEIGFNSPPIFICKRGTAVPPKQKIKNGTIKHRNLINSSNSALSAKGFLRSQKPFTPPEDATERVKKIVSANIGNVPSDITLSPKEKFQLLNACFKSFHHSVPNSMLHTIKTPLDVLNFYNTTVTTTTPYEELRTKQLPPNLHVQYDYVRFHPDTDTMFNGITAYPESSTIVTGLKAKEKYQGYKQRAPAHLDEWSDYIRHDVYDPQK